VVENNVPGLNSLELKNTSVVCVFTVGANNQIGETAVFVRRFSLALALTVSLEPPSTIRGGEKRKKVETLICQAIARKPRRRDPAHPMRPIAARKDW